ncbi:hypothetical protein PYCCODRAFT_1379783 [Trametes coccinea BRFM310]|uniref:RING-type domain-containing protein n=1 Tax=Trametes coccinea (strain BRFM310) TaxID=1353009 RepID=A0A1Y2J4F7_TRAC3|nr:hypothetical protein PYCCODRAFT_1379783 [Trametes coccinea BRFM310]
MENGIQNRVIASTLVPPSATSGPADAHDAAPQTPVHNAEQPPQADGNEPQRTATPRPRRTLWQRLLVLLGYAGDSEVERRARRRLVSFIVFLCVAVGQIVAITVVTAIAAVRKSPRPSHPGQTEFGACSDLAILNLIWLGRVLFICYLVFWARWMKRHLQRRRRAATDRATTVAGQRATNNGEADVDLEAAAFVQEPSAPTASDYICPMNLIALHVLIIKLSPALTLVWFVTAVLLSIERGARCREAAPAVSTLTVVLLLVIYARFVLVTLLSLLRVILARRRAGKPAIGKLSQAEVDRIPLVLYIPPPPGEEVTSPVSPPPKAHSRFPSLTKPAPHATPKRKKRFIHFKPKRVQDGDGIPVDGGDLNVSSALDYVDPWDASFEPAPYPLVRLPENKATCMICLCEFEAPRKVGGAPADAEGGEAHEMTPVRPSSDRDQNIEEVQVEAPRPADAATVHLANEEGGDAPQPLRLLSCGHAYHKECIDPWLTQKSGRCPYCQMRVDVPPPAEKRRRWWRRRAS